MQVPGRLLAGAVLSVVLLVAVIVTWRMNRSSDDWLVEVPADAMALVVVRHLPESFEFLRDSRLGEWVETEGLAGAIEALDGSEQEQLDLLREHIDGGWVALHRVERKSNGALRPHLTGLLRPTGNVSRLTTWLEQQIAKRFESASVTVLEDGSRLIEGAEPGETFFLKRRSGALLVSNSPDGWQAVSAGPLPGQGALRAEVVEALIEPPGAWDLLVYFRGPSPLDLVPSFLYRLDFERPGQDDYRQLEDVQRRQIGVGVE